MSTARATLVIGFPGELARRAALELAHRERPVRLLVQPTSEPEAEAFVAALPGGSRPVVGDLEHIDLGLPGPDYLALARDLESIVLAELPAPPHPEETAPPGSDTIREVLELARAAPTLAHAIVLSHVDVAGDFSGRFAERDLDLGQRFHGPAQSERHHVERVCHRFAGELPLTVVRAGWVVGPAPGLAPLIALVLAAGSELARHASCRLALAGIDNLSRLLGALVDHPPAPGGRVLHAADPAFLRLDELEARIRAVAGELAPGSFDLQAGARRVLQRSTGSGQWSPREFFSRQPLATIETTWTERFLADRGLPTVALEPGEMDRWIEHAIEEIVGLR